MQTTTIVLYIASYVLFFVFNWKSIKDDSQRLINDNGDFTSKPKQLLLAHFIGAVWLGIVPVMTLKESVLNVLIETKTIETNTILLYVLTFIVILFVALQQSKNAYEKREQPSGSLLHLSAFFFGSYFMTRALFLFSYELWFRGGLLFETAAGIGMPLAIVANIFLYVLLHVFNSQKELLACIPFGIVSCLFCFAFNAAWPAILMHIGFSLGYEINFYRLNLIHLKNTTS